MQGEAEIMDRLALMGQFQQAYGPLTTFEDLHAFLDFERTGILPPRAKRNLPVVEANTITLAADVTSDVKYMRYYNAGATAWPKAGDRENQPVFQVPQNLYKRTVWLQVSAFGGTWFWIGRLVARLGGVKTFEMPLVFSSGGTATRHSLSIGYDQDNAGTICEDRITVNDNAGNPLIPFSFVAAAQTIGLEEEATDPGTSDTRMIFFVRSQSMW